MKAKFKHLYMEIAGSVSRLSYAKRLQVGAIIVKDDRIISMGYNGTPTGWDNTCEEEIDGVLVTKPEVLHAETNALAKLAKSSESGDNASLFVTHAPCMNCAKLIYQAGIKQVYYKKDYRDTSGRIFLKRLGVYVEEINE
jgi:dCMP deaminase